MVKKNTTVANTNTSMSAALACRPARACRPGRAGVEDDDDEVNEGVALAGGLEDVAHLGPFEATDAAADLRQPERLVALLLSVSERTIH